MSNATNGFSCLLATKCFRASLERNTIWATHWQGSEGVRGKSPRLESEINVRTGAILLFPSMKKSISRGMSVKPSKLHRLLDSILLQTVHNFFVDSDIMWLEFGTFGLDMQLMRSALLACRHDHEIHPVSVRMLFFASARLKRQRTTIDQFAFAAPANSSRCKCDVYYESSFYFSVAATAVVS